jgi:hypothetical protein
MIDSRQQALWERLGSFVIGTGSEPVSFVRRLARENAWSLPHSNRVLREYYRFIFLCSEAGHPCTPSDAVDQAWHLHLVYTRSYWNELCPLLRRPVHHGPTEGGIQEDAKQHDWYARTLASYRRMFGEEPPADIWPATFEPEPETVRVSRREFWLLPRRSARMVGVSVVVALAIGGCSYEAADGMLAIYLFIVAVSLLIVASINADRNRRRGDGSGSGSCGATCSSGDCGVHDGGGSDSGGDGGGSGCGGGCGGGD